MVGAFYLTEAEQELFLVIAKGEQKKQRSSGSFDFDACPEWDQRS